MNSILGGSNLGWHNSLFFTRMGIFGNAVRFSRETSTWRCNQPWQLGIQHLTTGDFTRTLGLLSHPRSVFSPETVVFPAAAGQVAGWKGISLRGGTLCGVHPDQGGKTVSRKMTFFRANIFSGKKHRLPHWMANHQTHPDFFRIIPSNHPVVHLCSLFSTMIMVHFLSTVIVKSRKYSTYTNYTRIFQVIQGLKSSAVKVLLYRDCN